MNLSIGQGDLLVTPLQMVRLAVIIANAGTYPKLHLVRYIEDAMDKKSQWANIDTTRIENISQKTYKQLRQGMYRAVQGKNGTALAAYCKNIRIAGKTGSAQNPHGNAHSWFIGFAPYENPEIAICVFVENGGSGSKIAAPIAGQVIRKYFNLKNTRYAQF